MATHDDRRCISLEQALGVGRLWLEAGGNPRLDIAALEPLLWRDGPHLIADLVREMSMLGFAVAITTNAQHLRNHAKPLADAKLSKLRISWHTTSPGLFRQITATGNYVTFLKGVFSALDCGIPTSFNRVLLKGYTADFLDHVALIDGLRTRLKVYDLYWTPQNAELYEQFYINAIETADEFIAPIAKRRVEHSAEIGRDRVEFELKGGGSIEVKESHRVLRDKTPCLSCKAKDNCLEEFGDYVRVEPDMNMYFCYLRRDIGLCLTPMLESGDAPALVGELDRLTDGRGRAFLRESRLRFIAVPYCNFNCGFPGSKISWCHKATGNFTFPARLTQNENLYAA